MLKQIMTSPGVIEFENVAMPDATEGKVVVKIMRIGICGSDIHVYHGKHPFTSYPITQGHEVSGIIHQIGKGVNGLTIGQRVTIEPQVVCGECHPCKNGKYNLCENLKVMGFQTIGTASEYVSVDAAKITTLSNEISYDEGAMIEPLSVTVHAAKRFENLKGAKVAVIGAGPIGNLLAQTCKALGASSVMVTDISDYRLSIAKECGADYTINTKIKNFGEAMVECFGKDKADVIYDCAGNNATMAQAIQYSRKGSKIVLVAVFSDIASIDLAVLNDKELDLDTAMMYRHEDYVDAIKLVQEQKIKLKPLMSKHFKFLDYKKAYEYIEENQETTMKVIIDVADISE